MGKEGISFLHTKLRTIRLANKYPPSP